MKKNLLITTAIIITLFLLSCNKDSDTPTTIDIKGNWTFISMDANTTAIVESSQGAQTQKTITYSSYTTQNNTGTITTDASTMKANHLSYSVNTTAKSYVYQNNVLTDSLETPFGFAAPPSSSGVPYKYVSSDSIYFEGGTLFMNGVTQNITPGGAKLKLNGDTLYMTQYVHEAIDHSVSGVTVKSDNSSTSVIKLKRQ
jgi:uncharacterized membrane protein